MPPITHQVSPEEMTTLTMQSTRAKATPSAALGKPASPPVTSDPTDGGDMSATPAVLGQVHIICIQI